MPFPAKYPGECCECGEPFAVDTLIMYTDNDELCHQTCPAVRAPGTCGYCFTELPLTGVCGVC